MDQMKSALSDLNRIKGDVIDIRQGMADLMKHLKMGASDTFDKVGEDIADGTKTFCRQAVKRADESVKAVDQQLADHPYASAMTALTVLGAGLLIAKMVRK